MERTDFIESRVDVVKNIYTLYSYAKSDVVEDRKWALQRYRQGKWFVVERFGDTLLFAPLKFVSYKDNTIDKHKSFNVEDRQIFSRFKKTGLYREASDKFLEEQFESFILELGGEKINPKFLIPKTLNIFELTTEGKCYFIPPADIRGCEEDVWKYFLSYNTIAIEGIISDKNYNKHFYHQFDKLILK